ncbi:DUF2786 domain-containing protein [Streptomyces sp. NPDC059740]|uniref:DUF2786 domain-containing protein n=1 Tax=Streptomyces sp. NPDC059740 TaxID=3346926 RepID=UPI00364F2B6E
MSRRRAGRADTGHHGGPRTAEHTGTDHPGTGGEDAAELVAAVLGELTYLSDGPAVDDALEAGASRLAAAQAGPEAVGSALLAAAVERTARNWDGGWTPADLVRVVRRDLTDQLGAGPEVLALTSLALDAVAAEARRAAHATGADPYAHARARHGSRWAEQLRDLAAETWWQEDAAYLDALVRRRQSSRFETLLDLLRVLRTLARQPRIPPLPDATAPAAADPATARVLGRIRALLAKAEATTYPEEAEALSAKAQELMARHSVDEALAGSSDGARGAGPGAGNAPTAIRVGVEGPYEEAKALLLDAVAGANRCQAVWSEVWCFTTLVGFAADLERTELLYTSLLVQATTAAGRAADAHHARGRSRRTRDFRQSFLVAYADRIRHRLDAATHRVTRDAAEDSPSLLPALASREAAVQEATGALFPQTTAVRLRGVRDAEGWRQGTAAAEQARLGEAAEKRRGITGR